MNYLYTRLIKHVLIHPFVHLIKNLGELPIYKANKTRFNTSIRPFNKNQGELPIYISLIKQVINTWTLYIGSSPRFLLNGRMDVLKRVLLALYIGSSPRFLLNGRMDVLKRVLLALYIGSSPRFLLNGRMDVLKRVLLALYIGSSPRFLLNGRMDVLKRVLLAFVYR